MARAILISRFLLVDTPGAVELADDPRALAQRDVIGWDNLGASVRNVEIALPPRMLARSLEVGAESKGKIPCCDLQNRCENYAWTCLCRRTKATTRPTPKNIMA